MSLPPHQSPPLLPAPSAPSPCSTPTTTPADYRALGLKGVAVKRAQGMAARTASERRAYRQGYVAAAQCASRLRQLLRGAAQSLQP